ncbi:MCE family protein [Mycolicibacterium sp.]|uniref:MCE family protein n=1 Tax=Mycolicibacterium sp. TaxID=2320850 RepID=UPI003D12C215
MRLTARLRIQLAVFCSIALTSAGILLFGYLKVPATYFGMGRYTVTVDLPEAGGLYHNANVVYRGTAVGRVQRIELADGGVQAVLSLDSAVRIPADVDAAVHSVSAAGEQYVSLTPRNDQGPALADGDVVATAPDSVQPDINALLDATNRGLAAIPRGELTTVVDESYLAVAGLGPELARIVDGSTRLAIDARDNLAPILTLIDQSKPVLDTQADTRDDITAWAAHLAELSGQLAHRDQQVAGILQKTGPALDEAAALFSRLRPTLPILMANLVAAGNVAVTYQPALEQLLVLLPANIAGAQATAVPNLTHRGPYKGLYLDVALNMNLPPVCNTGFLPPQQRRATALQDAPARPAGDLYCRVPQDSPFNTRGARNYPCLTVPGKRAPTVKMCESDQTYSPLNDGDNWKGDPNATLSGQAVPQRVPAPLAVSGYDAATGEYVAPDGSVHRQGDLAAPELDRTWQTMLLPPS